MDSVGNHIRDGEWALILPGVVSHAANVVEHPELVAERILRFANLVGRERVIASTDCGLGGRVHPDIAWAKLDGAGPRRGTRDPPALALNFTSALSARRTGSCRTNSRAPCRWIVP